MTKEELLALGLAEEQIVEVFKINGKDIEKHKADLTTVQTELASTKEQLTTANTEIESYKSMDIEAIKAAAESYKTKFETTKTDLEKQIESLKFEHSIENALGKAGAKNIKAAKALLDIEALKGSQNRDSDIEAAITTLKETETYLFREADPTGTGGSMGGGAKGGAAGIITKEEFNKMSYKERVELFNKQPDVYKTLKE